MDFKVYRNTAVCQKAVVLLFVVSTTGGATHTLVISAATDKCCGVAWLCSELRGGWGLIVMKYKLK